MTPEKKPRTVKLTPADCPPKLVSIITGNASEQERVEEDSADAEPPEPSAAEDDAVIERCLDILRQAGR